MIAGIESGEISHVLVKDLSRVGRDYLQVGFYTEVMFKERGVRFIAIANGVDSDRRESSEFAWVGLFAFIYSNSLHITRLDVAFDDHTGILDIERIAQDTQEQRFVSRMKYWEVVRSSGGTSCQIGSPKSKVLVRIYDKAAERGY